MLLVAAVPQSSTLFLVLLVNSNHCKNQRTSANAEQSGHGKIPNEHVGSLQRAQLSLLALGLA